MRKVSIIGGVVILVFISSSISLYVYHFYSKPLQPIAFYKIITIEGKVHTQKKKNHFEIDTLISSSTLNSLRRGTVADISFPEIPSLGLRVNIADINFASSTPESDGRYHVRFDFSNDDSRLKEGISAILSAKI